MQEVALSPHGRACVTRVRGKAAIELLLSTAAVSDGQASPAFA